MTIANDKKFGTADRPSEARRRLLQVAMSSATLDLFGCCNMRDWAKPEITLALRPSDATIFKPATIYKSSALPKVCIDVHTHFFNASDVPVKGFLEGPIAHAMPSLAWLIRLLGPIAEGLSEIAPSAAAEYAEINDLERSVAHFGIKEAAEILDRRIATHRKDQSLKFFDLVNSPRGKPFLAAYDKLQAENRQTQLRAFPGERARSLDEGSLTRAMVANEIPLNHEALRIQALPKEGTYAEGILGFIGYMLSYRWSNLLSYQKAFSTHENSLGMDRVLSALVDFDRWLECPPRSSHEDQMRLFDLISRHSDRYMLPLIGYNPWTDAVDEAKSPGLERVKVQLCRRQNIPAQWLLAIWEATSSTMRAGSEGDRTCDETILGYVR